MITSTSVGQWGPYTIRATRIGQAFAAQIFRGRELVGPRHSDGSAELAMEAAKDWLEQRAATERAERKATGVPSVRAYTEAFNIVGLNVGERAMIEAHLDAPWHKLTATELAQAAGWKNWSSANLHYGGLGRKVAEALDWMPPSRSDGTPIWTMTIAVPAALDDVPADEQLDFLMSSMETGGEFEWTLRPQVVAAISDL